MRKTNWTPSIVPGGDDQTVYLVADDFGKMGRAWREADYETTELETVIRDLLSGQYSHPIRSLRSTLTNDGQRTFRKTWLMNYGGVAICRR